MLIPNQLFEIKWNKKNKSYYEGLGYKFTISGDTFLVKAEDLSHGSHHLVKVRCDFCGKIVIKKMATYILQHHDLYGDCCKDCQPKKNKLVCMDKYGVDNGAKTQFSINKTKNTCMERYGVSNGAQTKESRQKISYKVKKSYEDESIVEKRIKTNKQRYGYKYPIQNKQIKEKQRNTLIERYGVDHPKKSIEIREREKINNRKKYGCDYYSQTEEGKKRVRETNLQKYGVPCTLQSKEVRAKGIETMLKNGICMTSKQQIQVFSLLKELYGNCEMNKPCGNNILDCVVVVDGYMIDVEYDGRYWHQDKQRDRKRDEFCKSQGYKILRINARKSIPSKKQIQEAIDRLVNQGYQYTYILLDI